MAVDVARLALPRLELGLVEYNGLCIELSDKVNDYCVNSGESFDTMVVLPRGSFVVADVLSRRLGFGALDIVSSSQTSYEFGKTEAGERHIGQTLVAEFVEGLDLLAVDDTSDTDLTLEELKGIAFSLGARSVKTAVVVYKPLRNKTGIKSDFFVVEYNGWVEFPSEVHDKIGENSVANRKNRLRLEEERR